MTKCPSLDGLFPWEAVQMVVDTTTTLTRLFEVVTGLSLLTSMFQVALLLLRPYSMDFSSCRRRLTGARISTCGGPSEGIHISRQLFSCILMTIIIQSVLMLALPKRYVKGEVVFFTCYEFRSWDVTCQCFCLCFLLY